MNILEDFPLSEIAWYKIGGSAKYLLEVENTEDVKKGIEFIKEKNINKYLVMGLGANLLISDNYFDGAVIHMVRSDPEENIKIEDNVITAFAGILLDDLIHASFDNHLIGLEWAGGLPSTVGGAIRGNVGAFGSDISKICKSAVVIDENNIHEGSKELSNEKLEFGYRDSYVKRNKNIIVSEGSFNLSKANDEELKNAKKTYYDNIAYRQKNHPIEYPSCGSTFKNITNPKDIEKIIEVFPDLEEKIKTKWHNKASMGAIIAHLGLCGFTIGNAQISEKHPNFIINLGGATFNDVYNIINTVKEKFKEKFDFEPQSEVEIIQ